MKKKVVHNIVSLFFSVVITLPAAVGLWHELVSEHTHEVCTVKDAKHYHKSDTGCDIFHLNVKQPLFAFDTDLAVPVTDFSDGETFIFNPCFSKYQFLKLRGRSPPEFIV